MQWGCLYLLRYFTTDVMFMPEGKKQWLRDLIESKQLHVQAVEVHRDQVRRRLVLLQPALPPNSPTLFPSSLDAVFEQQNREHNGDEAIRTWRLCCVPCGGAALL